MSFMDIVWFILITFAFTAYLMLLWQMLADLFQDPEPSGLAKAVWVLGLIFVPFLTAVIYLIARGPGMAERSWQHALAREERQAKYIREVAAPTQATPADQIASARSMLDAGVISQSEFDRLKEKALV